MERLWAGRAKAFPESGGAKTGKRLSVKITSSNGKAIKSSPEFQGYYRVFSDHFLASSATAKEPGKLPKAGAGLAISSSLYSLVHLFIPRTFKSLLE